MKRLRVLVVAVLSMLVVGVLAVPATADPKLEEGESLTANCGDGDVPLVSNGGGQWTAAHDLRDNTVYQPVGFGPTFFELRNADTGEVVDSGFDPTVIFKNGNRKGQTVQECTFSALFFFTDPDLGIDLVGEFGGTVFIKA